MPSCEAQLIVATPLAQVCVAFWRLADLAILICLRLASTCESVCVDGFGEVFVCMTE